MSSRGHWEPEPNNQNTNKKLDAKTVADYLFLWNNLQRAENLKTANYKRKMATPSQLFVTEWDEID